MLLQTNIQSSQQQVKRHLAQILNDFLLSIVLTKQCHIIWMVKQPQGTMDVTAWCTVIKQQHILSLDFLFPGKKEISFFKMRPQRSP